LLGDAIGFLLVAVARLADGQLGANVSRLLNHVSQLVRQLFLARGAARLIFALAEEDILTGGGRARRRNRNRKRCPSGA
jgi:hypothetical protein